MILVLVAILAFLAGVIATAFVWMVADLRERRPGLVDLTGIGHE